MNEICVISDCHLGYRHRLKYQRLRDYENAFRDAVEKAMKFEPKILIFLGDLFHYARPDPRTMHLVIKNIIKMADKCKIVLCIGNHEIEGNLETAYLPFFSEIHENIHVLSTESPHIAIAVEGKKLGIHGFEFLRNKENAEKALEKIFSETSSGNDVNILCLHQALQSYLEPCELSLQTLKTSAKRFHLILLGHVHKHQKVAELFQTTPTYYVGSTERISFNESENKNGFLVFHDFNFTTPEFVPVNSAKMKVIKEELGEKTPAEINTKIKDLIEKNSDAKCLQIDLTAEIKGDFLEMKHDWQTTYKNFTILEVNVTPKNLTKDITIEKIELNEKMIEEYFEKIGLKEEKELKELCLQLYEKYGK